MNQSRVVAIVPAQLPPAPDGSPSRDRTLLRPLGGVPLVAYSIDAGVRAPSVERVIVLTHDAEISDVARRFGADVAGIPSTMPDVVRWLDEHDGGASEILVWLDPASPFRPPDCIDVAVARLRDAPSLDGIKSIVPAAMSPCMLCRVQEDGLIAPSTPDAVYVRTNHVAAMRVSAIREQASPHTAAIGALTIDPAWAIDVRSDADWPMAEFARTRLPLVRPAVSDHQFPVRVRAVVFDFDGVLTDNRVWVTGSGQEWVACNRSDGLGLSGLRTLGLDLLVLSTETDPVVSARCRKLGIECVQGVADKGARLRELLAQRAIDPADVIYVGNDINDLDCLRLVGCAVVVADAHPDVLPAAHIVLARAGGHGAVRELCDRLRAHLDAAKASR